jgi:predicted amidophosphoribosyltransferase
MANFTRRQIPGKWRQGFCLDLHTLDSTFLGYDEFGHPQYDTKRSEVGELLYRLKFKGDQSVVPEIVEAVATLMTSWKPAVDILVPVPPSGQRAVQPVMVLAQAISQRLGLPLANCITRTRNIPQLKNVRDLDERSKLLEGLHVVDATATEGKRVLLFDDLYRSGATMNEITNALYEAGKVINVFALTITRTRSNQ